MKEAPKGILLPALDGANPLGFFAALGVHQALADQNLPARMRWVWVRERGWRPELEGPESLDAVLDALERDLETWEHEPALTFSYVIEKNGQQKTEEDLRPHVEDMARFMRDMRKQGGRSEQFALAYTTDVAAKEGRAIPTMLRFVSGPQRFLEMVKDIRNAITREHLREALEGPWRQQDDLPVLGWSPEAERNHALRAFRPGNEDKKGTAGAEWLAFLGMRCLPTVPEGPDHNRTTGGYRNQGNKEVFRWIIWTVPLTAEAACSALQQVDHATGKALPDSALKAWGIGQVFESNIKRRAKGYGSFSPPRIIKPGVTYGR